jgi:glycosyltransferase involved in cell wall biosynthesis
MRIVHIVPYFYPAWRMGGTPRAVYELALAQSRLGHEVRVVTTDIDSPGRVIGSSSFDRADAVQETGADLVVKHRGLRILYCRSRLTRLFSSLEAYLIPGLFGRLNRLAQENRPDAIHVHELRTGLSLSAAALARRYQIPLVVSTHGSLFSPATSLWKAGIKRIFDFTVGRRLLSPVACFHAVSKREAEDIRRLTCGRKPIRIIPHGLSLGTPRAQQTALKPPFPALLFAGRIHPIKGLETLLEAWSLVKRRHSQAALLLLGQGNRTYVRNVASRFGLTLSLEPEWQPGRAVYGGHVAPTVVADRLARATCLIVPSDYEVWGLVILEALAAGCPVVATHVCGCLEHLDDRSGVVVVPPGDVKSLAEALEALIANSPRPSPPPARLSWESVAKAMTALYSVGGGVRGGE